MNDGTESVPPRSGEPQPGSVLGLPGMEVEGQRIQTSPMCRVPPPRDTASGAPPGQRTARPPSPAAAGPARPRIWAAAPPACRGGSRCRRGRGRRPTSTGRRSAPAPVVGAGRACGRRGQVPSQAAGAVGESGEAHRSPEHPIRRAIAASVASWPCGGPTRACAISWRIVSRTSSSVWTAVSGALSPS